MINYTTEAWMVSLEIYFPSCVQPGRGLENVYKFFWIKQVQATKTFCRSCLQVRKAEKPRQKEFLMISKCLNWKKAIMCYWYKRLAVLKIFL